MSEQEPQTPTLGFSINQLLRAYRELARLSQNELAGLSADLYAEGVLDAFYTQPAIARYEAQGDTRTKRLRAETIRNLSALFERALRNAGFNEVEAANLAGFLQAANEQPFNPRYASDFALEVDANLAIFPLWLREIARENIRTSLSSMRDIYLRYTLTGQDNE